MNTFITFRDKDENGVLQYYILQRDFPHLIGVVWNHFDIGNWYAPIMGYMLYVNFNGTLRGNVIPSYKDVGEEIQTIMQAMADWYYTNRIMEDEKKYKKFKVNATTSIQQPNS